jgi:PRC-barrel domain
MTTAEQLEQWRGRHVVDADGDDIGKLAEVYYSNSGEPVLARVSSGLLGRHHALVPLADSSVSRDYLRVSFRKAQIESAGTGEIGDVIDAGSAAQVGQAYGVSLPDTEYGYESAAQIEARRAAAVVAQQRAAALEAQASQLDEHAATNRADASRAQSDAAEAERAAEEARRAAAHARKQAEAAAALTRPPSER